MSVRVSPTEHRDTRSPTRDGRPVVNDVRLRRRERRSRGWFGGNPLPWDLPGLIYSIHSFLPVLPFDKVLTLVFCNEF